jgi:gluconokinase
VLTCSALKRKYRDRLRSRPAVRWALCFSISTTPRLQRADPPGHFFSPDLVANQFATLEDPRQERRAC